MQDFGYPSVLKTVRLGYDGKGQVTLTPEIKAEEAWRRMGGESGILFGTVGHASQGGPVRALSFSDNGDVEGPLVFAGYGIVVPENQGLSYDSYATLDVKDKVVLVLRYFPEDADQKTKAILSRYADLRYKAMAARRAQAPASTCRTAV